MAQPRLHHQWLPDELQAEAGALAPEVAIELERRGHRVVAPKELPKVQAVRILSDGLNVAAADPRGPGSAGVVAPDKRIP